MPPGALPRRGHAAGRPGSGPYSAGGPPRRSGGAGGAGGRGLAVGGLAAQQRDVLAALFGAPLLFYAGLFVIGATYLALAAGLRSPVAPSRVCSLVFVFQEGRLLRLLNLTATGFVDAPAPILVFGISMDYEVFLLSRIKEAGGGRRGGAGRHGRHQRLRCGHPHHRDRGLAFADTLQIKALGLGTAAVFIAAFVMQVLSAPAIMKPLGKRAWWPGGGGGRRHAVPVLRLQGRHRALTERFFRKISERVVPLLEDLSTPEEMGGAVDAARTVAEEERAIYECLVWRAGDVERHRKVLKRMFARLLL
nr:hypothetical protein [Rubrobacter xylanophilus]